MQEISTDDKSRDGSMHLYSSVGDAKGCFSYIFHGRKVPNPRDSTSACNELAFTNF